MLVSLLLVIDASSYPHNGPSSSASSCCCHSADVNALLTAARTSSFEKRSDMETRSPGVLVCSVFCSSKVKSFSDFNYPRLL
jgi:hypothetical protein